MGHCQHEADKYNCQGHEYHYIGFDQLEQFTENQYDYLKAQQLEWNRLEGQEQQKLRSTTEGGSMKTITLAWLRKQQACLAGIDWFRAQHVRAEGAVLKALIVHNKLDWASWLLAGGMTYRQYVAYGIYAAEQVLSLYERYYTDDSRPRQAIEAAKRCLTHPITKNKRAARAASEAARVASEAASAASWTASWTASEAARAAMLHKLLAYGLTLFEGKG